tara:strand:+ start:732 stop:1163 length:432 start_codon:yes stop_codon:yes gene_type:complete
MLIFNNLNDINAVYGILEKVANEVNDYYWRNNSEVDLERASELRDLEEYLISHGYIDKSYDLAKLTYSFLELYPQSVQAQENNRQYHEVLNKLSDSVKGKLLWDIRNMEKNTGEKVDKSIKFNMALERLLGERESEIVESYEE